MATIERKDPKNKSARNRRNLKLRRRKRQRVNTELKQLYFEKKLDQLKKSLQEQQQIKILENQDFQPESFCKVKLAKIHEKQLHLLKKLNLRTRSSPLASPCKQQQQIYTVQVDPNVPATNPPTGNMLYYIPSTAGTPIYISSNRPPDPPGFRPPGPQVVGQPDPRFGQSFPPGLRPMGPVQQETAGQGEWLEAFADKKVRRAFVRKTLCMSYIMGSISCVYDTNAVLMAIGICVIVCFVVTVFSFYTKFDFTNCGGIMCILLIVLLIFGIVAIIVRSHTMTMVYAGVGALVFMAFLAYDTQLIMGGKMHAINPEEYVFAALSLYVDVMYIFMYILMLFGGTGER
nr:uncharacterized protein LOC107452439 isoform X2 [Parasteatoda tepidariorum]